MSFAAGSDSNQTPPRGRNLYARSGNKPCALSEREMDLNHRPQRYERRELPLLYPVSLSQWWLVVIGHYDKPPLRSAIIIAQTFHRRNTLTLSVWLTEHLCYDQRKGSRQLACLFVGRPPQNLGYYRRKHDESA